VFSVSLPIYSPQSRAMQIDAGPRLITLVRLVEGMLGASSLS
jgi:hypothetical protein